MLKKKKNNLKAAFNAIIFLLKLLPMKKENYLQKY